MVNTVTKQLVGIIKAQFYVVSIFCSLIISTDQTTFTQFQSLPNKLSIIF